MQTPFYVEAKDILNATNGGLDIIFMLYPQAVGSEIRHTRKFKVHEEKTASTSLKQADDGNWLVTNWGDDSETRNGIMCYAHEKGLKYVDALRELAVMFNVVSEEKKADLIKADYSERPAEPNEDEGTWTFNVRDKSQFTDAEIELIISKNVLYKLYWKSAMEPTKAENARAAIQQKFRLYNWHPLISYSYVKNRRHMTYTATDQYPMFLIDEKSHQKIYQPKHPDKGRRFMYSGEKPKDFIHGLAQLNKAYDENKADIDGAAQRVAEAKDSGRPPSSEDEKNQDKDPKLDEVVLCSGGSDAINVALLGYRVIWLNSETAKLFQYQYDKIAAVVKKLYQLPDIDVTGKKAAHELNMLYLDMYSIELPDELLTKRDQRGNPCKDVRDYFNHYRAKDFKKLIGNALPYRFWEMEPSYTGRGENRTFNGYKYEFDSIQALNFLSKNGFGILHIGDDKKEWIYVRITGNTVQETDAEKIQRFIHDFLKERQFDKKLRNAMMDSGKLNATKLTMLEPVTINFTDNTKDSQLFFFQNKTVEVTADSIHYHKLGAINRFAWEEEVLKHHIEEIKQEPFTVTKNQFGDYDIEIHDTTCPFLQYLVQTSRVHWREELEYRADKMPPEEAEKYRKDYKCSIAGPNLNEEEIAEQKLHLVNKIFAIGYLLHRYKARHKGWFVWAQDNKINDDGQSHGGSGKSILFDMAIRAMLKKSMTLNGRNSKLNEDQFKYDGVTEHTRYLLIDDAHQYLKLDPFYKDITGDLNVNPKGKTPFTVPFEKSAKIAITSNYTPRDLGPSTERRQIPTAFSDYYHNKGETDDYKEMRDPTTDIGMTLFTGFGKKEWNSFYQVMMHALKFYLGTNEKIRPAMGNVNKRNMLAEMGDFYNWALVYFSEETGRLDKFIVRDEFQQDYRRYFGKDVTAQTMSKKLKVFCRFRGYVLNPGAFVNKDKNIIRKMPVRTWVSASGTWELLANAKKEAKECYYIQSKNELTDENNESDPNQVAPMPDINATPGDPNTLAF